MKNTAPRLTWSATFEMRQIWTFLPQEEEEEDEA